MILMLRQLPLIALTVGLLPTVALAQTPAAEDSAAVGIPLVWWLAPICSVLALAAAMMFYQWVIKQDPGNERMQEIAGYVRQGAFAYLSQQYVVVAIFLVVVAALLYVMSVFGVQHPLAWVAFLSGGLLSGLAGFFGMNTATLASSRTAQASMQSLNQGLTVAFRSGAVMGLVVVGLALLGVSGWFVYLKYIHHMLFGGAQMSLETITTVMLSTALGASSMALFARVGGGIYTKAADVGADLVGKVEVGIPEDDPRNPAAIADNVGDNVGDVAGMGADLFESYLGSILATSVLGVAAAASHVGATTSAMNYVIAPMVLAAVGILLSIVGVFLVRLNNPQATEKDLLPTLHRAVWLTNFMVIVVAAGVIWLLGLDWGMWGAIVVGLLAGGIIGFGTEYYTAAEYKPTQNIARQAESGTGPCIIGGIAEGMLSVWIPNVTIGVGTILAYGLAGGFGEGGFMEGLYGVGIAAVGMLSTLGITLATDAYGPIADNAGGNAEMARLPKEVRERTDALDSLGNTTAAIGKGFAIGSAALTALALLASYVEQIRVSIHREVVAQYAAPEDGDSYRLAATGNHTYGIFMAPETEGELTGEQQEALTISLIETRADASILLPSIGETSDPLMHLVVNQAGKEAVARVAALELKDQSTDPVMLTAYRATPQEFMDFYHVGLMNPTVLVGVFLGVTLVFVFSALTMKAVSNAAASMVQEVRRQFKEKPGIMEGTETPDYARCVSISTKQAQQEMVLPTLLALVLPVVVGLLFNVAGVMGLLLGGLASGFAMAVFMANSGGAWDNAKKYIEAGNCGGKGAEAHKAAVVGDTVGDPFKDTSGPSLNILIKLMNVVSIVFAGLVVKYAPMIGEMIGLR